MIPAFAQEHNLFYKEIERLLSRSSSFFLNLNLLALNIDLNLLIPGISSKAMLFKWVVRLNAVYVSPYFELVYLSKC